MMDIFGAGDRIIKQIDADKAYIRDNPPKCGNCYFAASGVSKDNPRRFCLRFPTPVDKNEADWCGEYKRRWPKER